MFTEILSDAMSATNSCNDTAIEVVKQVTNDQELRQAAAANGIKEAAEQAGYDLTQTEMEMALKEIVKQDLPSDVLDVDTYSAADTTAHSGCSRCCP